MKLFGSGINFYGGPGESAHKQFIKIPGQRTQRRVSEFAQQTALQYHNMLVSSYAAEECLFETNNRKQYGGNDDTLEDVSPSGHLSIILTGRYYFVVTEQLLHMMESEGRLLVKWMFDNNNAKQGNTNHRLHKDLVKMMHNRLLTSIGKTVTGYTKAVISCSGLCTPFYAHPCFHGHKWYDWALVQFEENNNQGDIVETLYPSRLLGFVSIDGKQEAAIQCSSKPILWNTVETKFIVQIKLGLDVNVSFVTVPIDSLVHPLCVIPDNGEEDCDTFFIVLPKRNWSRYFGQRIQIK
jgi:hypothetical protein